LDYSERLSKKEKPVKAFFKSRLRTEKISPRSTPILAKGIWNRELGIELPKSFIHE
jgi:hypothetical protein